MRKLIMLTAAAAIISATPALAKNHRGHKGAKAPAGVEILERDARGRPSKISMGGKEYMICTSDNSDGCINPREAGFNWGNNTAKDWPGRPISRSN